MSKKDRKPEQKSVLNAECSRRSFLSGSAAVTATLALGGLASSCATRPPATAPVEAAPLDPLLAELRAAIVSCIHSPANDSRMIPPMIMSPARVPFYDDHILLGVASGADPIWDYFKTDAVGDFHWTPREAFLRAFPRETSVRPEDLSVVSWILPFTEAATEPNRRQTFHPSYRWARFEGARCSYSIIPIQKLIENELTFRGIQAAAPYRLPESTTVRSERWGLASPWSERHAAYAAGLGTFGLSDGLITPIGKNQITSAVVFRHKMQATPRPYSSHREYCLFFKDGSCGECIKRCPAGSVLAEGRNKMACWNHNFVTIRAWMKETWGRVDGYGCGMCMTGVPCESRIPPGIVV